MMIASNTSDDVLNAFVRGLIDSTFELPHVAIDAYQTNATTLQVDHATVFCTSDDYLGTAEYVESDNGLDLDVETRQLTESTYSINFIKGNAKNRARHFSVALSANNLREIMTAAGLYVMPLTSIRSLPLSPTRGHEARAQLDLTIRYKLSYTELVRAIQTVAVTGNLHFNSKLLGVNL